MEDDRPDPLQGHTREWPSTPYLDEARAPEPAPESACGIGLFGECTVNTEPSPAMSHLAVRLRRAFPGQPFVIRNLAESGGTAREFVREGLEAALKSLVRLDIAFIRYGINDRKRDGIPGCITNLRALCQGLAGGFPGVTIFIETGMWVDYPRHYLFDRNPRLAPLYQAMREFAAADGHPLIDIFARMEAETRRGNWDLRIRGLPDDAHTVLDDSFDEFFGDDPAFFTNIHPNSRCHGLIAEWEVAALRERFGDRLLWGSGA